MRILAPLVLLLSSVVSASSTIAANAPDRPPGVDASHWVTLGKSIGVVLTIGEEATGNASSTKSTLPPLPVGTWCGSCIRDRTVMVVPTRPFVLRAVERAEAREPLRGYLMVKQGGVWRRLLLTSP